MRKLRRLGRLRRLRRLRTDDAERADEAEEAEEAEATATAEAPVRVGPTLKFRRHLQLPRIFAVGSA